MEVLLQPGEIDSAIDRMSAFSLGKELEVSVGKQTLGREGEDEKTGRDENGQGRCNAKAAYLQLGKLQGQFDSFLSLVEEDVRGKIKRMKEYRKTLSLRSRDRNYATLQLFMLSKYTRRLNRFKDLSTQAQEAIDRLYNDPSRPTELVAQIHIHSSNLVKMTRRLKHIYDVSEKYSVVEVLTDGGGGVSRQGSFEPAEDVVDHPLADRAKRRHRHSTGSLFTNDVSSSDSSASSPPPTPSSSPVPIAGSLSDSSVGCEKVARRRLKTFKSLSDHVSVLAKTYTNRK